MNTTSTKGAASWKNGFKIIINPGELLRDQMSQTSWVFSLFISGLAFSLFFLQTGLDLFRNGQILSSTVILITILGLLYGTAGIALLAIMVWYFSKGSERDITMEWAISSFALGYAATLIYALSGLIFSLLLGWKTAIAFGVTGLLWALRPTMFTIKVLSGDRVAFSIVMTTVCGVILLVAWSLLGKFGA